MTLDKDTVIGEVSQYANGDPNPFFMVKLSDLDDEWQKRLTACNGCKPEGTAVHYGSCPLGLEEQERRAERIAELKAKVAALENRWDEAVEHQADWLDAHRELREKCAALVKALDAADVMADACLYETTAEERAVDAYRKARSEVPE